ncbi:MAG: Rrf2 family transcriptional regulator [Candidatus Omnitrophica bacterium]|nr:Rrf2 family transcriptional regulator [Candidatus Omnitrophota bacterium]
MRISTRIRYGLRAMIDLSGHCKQKAAAARDIASRTGISVKYLEQVLLDLKKGGLVRSVRGMGGGFLLAREPEKITALEVVTTLGGSLTLVDCLETRIICKRSELCAARKLWARVNEAVCQILSTISLKELADQQAICEKMPTYVI